MEALNEWVWTYQTLLYLVAVNCLLGLSMYCVLAAGQLFLGQIAFMALGAYTSAICTTQFGMPFAVSLLAGIGLPMLVALALASPMLRLSGVYLAIGTIAFGEVVRAMAVNIDFLGGALGITGIPRVVSLPAAYGTVVVVAGVLIYALRSKVGREIEAVRTDEAAAQAMGVNVFRLKLGCVLLSAALAGLAGVISAHALTAITPSDFSFEAGVSILSYAVLGGVSSPIGALVGAAVLTTLPELLRGFSEFRMMINGLVVVLVVMFFPSGIVGLQFMRIRAYAKR